MITKTYLKTLKQSEVSALLRCADRTVMRWHDEGLPRTGNGRGTTYNWAEVCEWQDSLEEKNGGNPDDRARKLCAEADIAEMERDAMAGKYLLVSDVRKEWATAIGNCRARLLSIPAKAALRIEDGMNVAQREAVVRDEIYEALTELSGREAEAAK